MVTTIHGFSGAGILPAYLRSRSAFVAISDADRSPDLDYVATVHHGIDMSEFRSLPVRGDDLIAFGRIHPDKGTAEAIEIAARAGRRLVLCGIIQDPAYFAERVQPHIDGDRVVYRGSVGPAERTEVLGSAAALLHPIAFAEPFGLSVIEAMACGTPVIAYRRGSMPEVIDEGVTGFVVSGIEEAVASVPLAVRLDPETIRARARERFDAERMVDEYLRVYRSILEDPGFVKSPGI
jgi:glycosyltransferase involved in cell wall biosynthesis